MTGKELLKSWLKLKVGETFTERDLQLELWHWQQKYGCHYLPDSLSRYFRFVRDEKLLDGEGLEIRETEGKHKSWNVQPKQIQLMLF